MNVLTSVARSEKQNLPQQLAAKIAANSNRNLRRALLMLEAVVATNPTLPVTAVVPPLDWERCISTLASEILKEQSPKQLLQCRTRIYELLVNCIPGDVVLKRLCHSIQIEHGKLLRENVKHEIAAVFATYDHRSQLGSKEIFHIEAAVAKVMAVIKSL
jgi:replication factor C subunit 3/5